MNHIIRKIGIITGILLLTGATILSITYGFTTGNAISCIIGLLFLATAFWFHKLPDSLKKILVVSASTGFGFFLVITTIVILYGKRDTVTFNEDCVLVFGCGIRGETILPTLKARLDKCLEYLEKNPDVLVIVSGGKGRNEDISEAEAMKRYLVQNGIHDEQIILEDRSRNTTENIRFSKTYLQTIFPGDDYTVACITSDYHAYRTERTAFHAKIGTRRYNAGVKWYLRPSAYCREALSVTKFWFQIYGGKRLFQ